MKKKNPLSLWSDDGNKLLPVDSNQKTSNQIRSDRTRTKLILLRWKMVRDSRHKCTETGVSAYLIVT